MLEEMSASDLAGRLRVSVTTVTNWTRLEQDPLSYVGEGRLRRFTWEDYQRFASKHQKRRAVARQEQIANSENVTALDPNMSEVRTQIVSVLERLDSLANDAQTTGRSARQLRRELKKTLTRLGGKSLPESGG